MMSVNWPLNDWQLVLAAAICLDVAILGLIVTACEKPRLVGLNLPARVKTSSSLRRM